MKTEVNDWIMQAEDDLDTAKYNIKGEKINAGIFFLQQSAEKALKAVYMKRFGQMFKTHDLILLSKRLQVPKEIMNYCKELNPAYLYTRYPDVPQVENIKEVAKNLVNYSKEILIWAKKNI